MALPRPFTNADDYAHRGVLTPDDRQRLGVPDRPPVTYKPPVNAPERRTVVIRDGDDS